MLAVLFIKIHTDPEQVPLSTEPLAALIVMQVYIKHTFSMLYEVRIILEVFSQMDSC